MYLLGQRKNSESYKRWERKYRFGRMRRRSFRARTTTKSRGGQRNKRILERIKKLERGQSAKEFKYHDFTVNATSSSTPTSTVMNAIAQGDTSLTREGLEIHVQSIQLAWQMKTNSAANKAYVYRVVLLKDTMNQGVAPVWTDVYESNSHLALKERHVAAHGRFKIYYDKTFVVNPAITLVENLRTKKYYKRFKRPIKISYDDTGAGDWQKNSLFILVIGNTAADDGDMFMNGRLIYTE